MNIPFIMSWSGKVNKPGSIYCEPAHFIDIMFTLFKLTGATYAETRKGKSTTPMQGISLLPTLQGKSITRKEPLYWK
ncbi:MAG: hypothetical protein AAGA18_05880 [Verrucomicrobiota bacterium]